jgi:hypothetical protein
LFFLQEKRFNVLPRVCKTDLVQIAIAAASLAFVLERCFARPGRSFTVLRTDFIHLQNFVARFFIYWCVFFSSIAVEEMATTFQINRLTHTRDDLCGIESYFKQSVGPGNYAVTNLVPDARKVNPLGTEQLLIYPKEGYGYNNKEIDVDSVLRNQPEFKNNRCNIRPQARPFLSVPYMGTGRGNPDVESLLLHSEQVRQGKECGTVTEEFFTQQYTPLIPTVKQNIQNPKNLVPEVAAPGWIHGGIPTRSYIRDVNC